MLASQQKILIFELIQNVIYCEQLLENSRIKINQHLQFSLMPVFQRLDQSKRGQIRIDDIIQFYQENQIQIEIDEAYYILRRLDYNGDGQVTFKDFSKAMLPQIDSKQRLITVLRDPYKMKKQMKLPKPVEEDLILFFSTLLTFLRKQQQIKKNLICQPQFNVFSVYYNIDNTNKGYIDLQNFHEFIQELHLSDEQYYYFFQAVDIDQDGKITCNELIDILMNFPQDQLQQNELEIQSSYIGQGKTYDSENSQMRFKTDDSLQPSKRTLKIYNSLQSINSIIPTVNEDETLIKQKELLEQNTEQTAQKQQNFGSTDLLLTVMPNKEIRNKNDDSIQQIQSEWAPTTQDYDIDFVSNKEYEKYCSTIRNQNSQQKFQQNYDSKLKQDLGFLMKNMLVQCITKLKKIEKLKRQLTIKEEFNLLDAFRLFDIQGKGYAECSDIIEGYLNVGIETNEEDSKLLLKQYSKRQDSYLRYSDFCRMITPFHYDYSQILKQKKASYQKVQSLDEMFHSLTMQYYQDLLFLLLNFEIDLKQFKQKMRFNLNEIKIIFDLQSQQQVLDEQVLRQFLKQQHIYPTSSDLMRIIAHFNGNELGDCKIKPSAFCLE